jgi:putative hemolysin
MTAAAVRDGHAPTGSAAGTSTSSPPAGAAHIVDVLIGERAPHLLNQPATRWLMRHLFYPVLGYREAREALDRVQGMPGPAIMDHAAAELALRVRTLGLARLPARGRVVIATNHPTGLADGVAIWQALSPVRDDLKILANGDALRIAPTLGDVFIPVEWAQSKRTAASSRRILADVGAAFRAESALVVFPSGRLAYMRWHGLAERPWLPTAVTLARKFKAPILPIHIRARNSALFYGLSQVSHELRDVTLFHELLNKRGHRYELTLGLPIDPDDLPADPAEAIAALQRHVEHELPRASREAPRIKAARRPRRLARVGAPTAG